MLLNPDMIVVLVYFVIIILLGGKVTRKHKKDSLFDYLNGGKDMGWFRTSMTLIATSINVGIIGFVGIGFVWGMAIQPNAVNLWFSAPLLALFFLPIFWRTKIVTISELLEKRFNLSSSYQETVNATLYNLSGQVVDQQRSSGLTGLSVQAAGLYILKVDSKLNGLHIQKVLAAN